MKLSDFRVLTFDCYGTLIDWESGMMNALAPLLDQRSGHFTRNEILEAHAFHEASQQRQTPYWNLSLPLNGGLYRRKQTNRRRKLYVA